MMEPLGEAELDSRRRLSLARLADVKAGDRFKVYRLDDGGFRLEPVVSVNKRELRTLRDPKLMQEIDQGLKDAAAGRVYPFDPTEERAELEKKMAEKSDT